MQQDLLPESGWRETARHGMKFYTVGAIGIGVQLATLSLLTGFFKINYLIATFLAVEAAVLHNFLWHEHWTWSERTRESEEPAFTRLWRFNLSNGALSIAGNVIMMRILVGTFHFHFFPAQILSIGCCSLLNFLISDRLVFRRVESAD